MDIEGSVEDPANLKIVVSDFTLFDIGTGGYTEFEVTPEIILPVYEKNPDYIEKKYGCIHSHNNMNVFFSGTDTSTLLEQAFIHNFFVSLIINNEFDKIAKISYKGKKKVEKKEKVTFYNRIGNIFLPYTKSIDETTEEDVVYVIECNVEYEKNIPIDEELVGQIAIITKQEEAKLARTNKYKQTFNEGKNWKLKSMRKLSDFEDMKDFQYPYQKELFEEDKIKSSNDSFDQKCENFIKRLICIDYTGDETKDLSMKETREEYIKYYSASPRREYIEEVQEFCDYLLDEVFKKELEANWYEDRKFSKLRMMLSSQFIKLLDISIPIEKDVLEIIDLKLKELDNERVAGLI